jgi:SAM-dependent methyltransferase
LTKKRSTGTTHGNWVSIRLVIVPAFLAVISAVLILVSPYLLIPTGVFLLISGYFLYARYLFSPTGGDIQEKVCSVVMEKLDWDGKGRALDIGCGSGALTIQLAKRYSNSMVVGIDYWGGMWGYSEKSCQYNAKQEKVADRVTFQRASASSLPFDDEEFNAVVSNLVFHEVRDTSDKLSLIKEALRVLKKGGKFTFQDLFRIRQYYGKPEDLVKTIESWGICKVEYIDTRKLPFIPTALKLPFMLGTLGLLTGEK